MKIQYTGDNKERLDKFLTENLPQETRSQIKKQILAGKVFVNKELASVHRWLKKDDTIEIKTDSKKAKKVEIPSALQPNIIEQTSDYLVLEKPAGLLVHPTARQETDTLADWLRDNFPQIDKIGDDPMRPGIVHRLDRDVSGLMVVALTNDSFDALKKQFQKRTTKKEYLALVHGAMQEDDGEINTPLERNQDTGLMRAQRVLPSGKTAITLYQVVEKFINHTLIKVQIKTGRMHQIRAHLFSIGHSIVGDKLYQTKDLRKKNKTVDDARIFLHAHFLSFQDLNNIWQKYQSPLPKELKDFLKTIK
jgi:23S rRNA pseudouridine1911/1915/1917 synthase